MTPTRIQTRAVDEARAWSPARGLISEGRELMRQSLARPYKVTVPMVAFVWMVPFYIFIAEWTLDRPQHVPAIALDDAIPLVPAWSLIYGALYAFLIGLPVFLVREQGLIRRTVGAYLSIWATAYIVFIAYPTVASRPDQVPGADFGSWGLRLLYGMDPPHNCFPSLHVAHSFVSALACYRVHRRVGAFAITCASLVALSTLFTKQHYVLDVIAGVLMAVTAYAIFLGGHSRDDLPELDRKVAPVFTAVLLLAAATGLAGYWVASFFV